MPRVSVFGVQSPLSNAPTAISSICKDKDVLLGVDNTFMSPYFQRPLDLGADMVMHSSTKYLGGHSDVVGGVVCTSHPEVGERLKFSQNAMGAVMGPFDAWLTLRGLKTLGLRMDLMRAAFERTSAYDAAIGAYLAARSGDGFAAGIQHPHP